MGACAGCTADWATGRERSSNYMSQDNNTANETKKPQKLT